MNSAALTSVRCTCYGSHKALLLFRVYVGLVCDSDADAADTERAPAHSPLLNFILLYIAVMKLNFYIIDLYLLQFL